MHHRPKAVALLLLLAVAGCGGSIPVNSPSSPLGNGGGGLGECIPDASGGGVTYGIVELYNHSMAPVTVEHVSLYRAHHLQFVRAVSVPIRYNGIGVGQWPPVRQSLTQPGVQWNKRVAAAGSLVPATHGHSFNFAARRGLLRNVVIELRPTAHPGTAAGVEVSYRQDDQQYRMRAADKIKVIVGDC
jgi:hypothetical protein